jgi:soluble lytic murein transglycosylase-like protein
MIPKISLWELNGWGKGPTVDRSWGKDLEFIPSRPAGNESPGGSLERFFLAFLSKMIEKILTEAGIDPGSQAIAPPFPLEDFPTPSPEPVIPLEGRSESNSESKTGTRGQDFDAPIREAAARYDLEPDLIRAVIQVESNRNPAAVSPAGAQGLMQLMPRTAAELGVADSFDPAQNIAGGARYLRQLLDRYGGNRRLALAAYNWGMGNLEKRPEGLPKETQQYILRVEKAYNELLSRA